MTERLTTAQRCIVYRLLQPHRIKDGRIGNSPLENWFPAGLVVQSEGVRPHRVMVHWVTVKEQVPVYAPGV